VARLKAAVGRLDIIEFTKASKEGRTFAELENTVEIRHDHWSNAPEVNEAKMTS
jgi:hypothetical protein